MQQVETNKKDIVEFFLKKGVLLNQDILNLLENEAFFSAVEDLLNDQSSDLTVLNEKIKELIGLQKEGIKDINWNEIEKMKALSEKKQEVNYEQAVGSIVESTKQEEAKEEYPAVRVLYTYENAPKKRDAGDFVDSLKHRFKAISGILRQRQELQNTISINRLLTKKDREQVAVIGMISDKQYTKNGNCLLTLEDPTGSINVLVSKNKPDLFSQTKDIVMDEVIGITGTSGDKIVFVNTLCFPDLPISAEMKKSADDVNAIFLSDLHVGSNNFLQDDFEKFIDWLNGNVGDEVQKDTASKVHYIFIIGDLVDGVGIYPDQDKELTIKDLKGQYEECVRLLKKIPKHINLIVCPGNHDAMRVAEPQPPIYKDFCESLYDMENVTMVSNPSLLNIHSSEDFEGFTVLMYHGYSFDYYVAEVESIRNNGGYDRADLIMKLLLQKRHLAPAHTSTLYAPDITHDALVINTVPDFFVSGHIHKTAVTNHRGVTLICGSCWQSKTAFQEKVGHNPEPSRVPIVNLKTRNVKILRFGE